MIHISSQNDSLEVSNMGWQEPGDDHVTPRGNNVKISKPFPSRIRHLGYFVFNRNVSKTEKYLKTNNNNNKNNNNNDNDNDNNDNNNDNKFKRTIIQTIATTENSFKSHRERFLLLSVPPLPLPPSRFTPKPVLRRNRLNTNQFRQCVV